MILFAFIACTFVSDAEWQKRLDAECASLSGYLDEDGDGYGGAGVSGCAAVEAIALGGDCNDGDPSIHPLATEVWYDGVDQDCDGDVGDDQDGDGWPRATDCMDSVDDAVPALEGDCAGPSSTPDPALVHPGAEDVANDGVDADCSSTTDFDFDGDGWSSCTECDDLDPSVNPDATEDWYDGVDQDCDGNDDDRDLDGYAQGVDCDDDDPAVHPGAAEVFYDDVDDDCDSTNDRDADGDGYDLGVDCDDADGSINPEAAEIWYDDIDQNCDFNDDDQDGDGYAVGVDCDDADISLSPGALEIWYDDIDQDCDGNDSDQDGDGVAVDADCDDTADEVYPGADETWYDGVDQDCDGIDDDQDGDGFAVDIDCDDLSAEVRPGATEDCATEFDDDCDGVTNLQDAPNCTDLYVDGDGDTYGGGLTECWCTNAPGVVALAGDCDDTDADVRPGGVEDCGTPADDDCDGTVDARDALGCVAYHEDADADGLGAAAEVCVCTLSAGLTTDARDCDDADPAVGLAPSWFVDLDLDGLGDAANLVEACVLPEAASAVAGDCDDTRADVGGATPWFDDDDGDGYGDDASGYIACDGGSGVASGGDCDDHAADVHPGRTEDCATAADDDCSGSDNDEGADGATCFYSDVDRDSYGSETCHLLCRAEGVLDAVVGADCDDTSSAIGPHAAEVCEDGVDQDCDPETCALSGVQALSVADAVLVGSAVSEGAGRSVAGSGSGLLVGAFGAGPGRAWLWDGAFGGTSPLSGSAWIYEGTPTWQGIGDQVAFAASGGKTLLLGGANVAAWTTDGGSVLIFDGGTPGTVGPADARGEIIPNDVGQRVGAALVPAGQVDSTSTDSWFAVAAPGYADVGAVALFDSETSGTLEIDAGLGLLVGVDTGGALGSALAGGEDLDGDGLDDLVIGAPSAASGSGMVYILDDATVGTADALTYAITGDGGRFGEAVAVGDVDGSGVASVVVGASGAGPGGSAWVFSVDATSTADARATLLDETAGEAFGLSLVVGDDDADGVASVGFGISADGYVGTDGGAFVLFRSIRSGVNLASAADMVRYGVIAGDAAGDSLAALPDVDGDGFPEWVIGAVGEDSGGSGAGAVYVLFGTGD